MPNRFTMICRCRHKIIIYENHTKPVRARQNRVGLIFFRHIGRTVNKARQVPVGAVLFARPNYKEIRYKNRRCRTKFADSVTLTTMRPSWHKAGSNLGINYLVPGREYGFWLRLLPLTKLLAVFFTLAPTN